MPTNRVAPTRRYFPTMTRRQRIEEMDREAHEGLDAMEERLALRRWALGLPPAPKA